MRKRRLKTPWKVTIFVLASFLILSFGIGKVIQAIDGFTHDKEEIAVQVNSKQIDTGIKLKTESKESESFTSFVSYPFTEKEKIDKPIYEWITTQETLFQTEIEDAELMIDEDIIAHFNLQTDVYKINNHLFSFALIAEQLVEENEYSTMQTFTIDLENERILALSDVLNLEKSNVADFISIVGESTGDKETQQLIAEQFSLDQLDEMKWAIKEDQVLFYFNPGETGDNEEIVQIEVPIITIHTYINETFAPILITEEMQKEIANTPKELDPEGKYVALTFDDGPSEEVTPHILQTLEDYNAKATFFMLSQNAKNYPDIAKQVADAGHEVANHSVTHANLNTLGNSRIEEEVTVSLKQIEEATDVTPTSFRPPYGEFNQTVIDHAENSDQAIIMWSVDTLDWKFREAKSILEHTKQVTNGSIVLMHDIHQTTADALPQIMEYLSNEGFEFVTVAELLPLIEGEGVGPYYGN